MICALVVYCVDKMAHVVFKLADACVYVRTKLAGVAWPSHRDAKAVVNVIVSVDQVEALEAAKHVVDRQKSRSILVELRLDVH